MTIAVDLGRKALKPTNQHNFNGPFEISMGPLQTFMGPRILNIYYRA